MIAVALDSNLLLLLIVGRVSPRLVGRHKRLKSYRMGDFRLLAETIGQADGLIAIPNALTEVSNLAGYGLAGPVRDEVSRSLREVVRELDEIYRPSLQAVTEPEFDWLGLCDSAWLGAIGADTVLLTGDTPLYRAAISRGLSAMNFNALRQERGLI